jgi:hypothetical protein
VSKQHPNTSTPHQGLGIREKRMEVWRCGGVEEMINDENK